MRCALWVVSLCLVSAAVPVRQARAQPGPAPLLGSDKVAAEALFREGRKLMGEARYAEACAKFEASQRLDPGVGTMLNLAECYEKTGRTASAWAEFREVISAAREASSHEREELARRRAEALEAQLSRVTISLSPAASQVRGLEVRRDGALLDSAEFGSAIPVDPGKHTVEATAPGRTKWFRVIEVGASGHQEAVTVPEPPPAEEARPAAPSAVVEPQHSVRSGLSPSRSVAIALGAVGVAGLGFGAYYGLKASARWSDAKQDCESFPNGCSSQSMERADDARQAATLANIGFGLGLLGVASGTVLWLMSDPVAPATRSAVHPPATPPRQQPASARISVGPASVWVRGNF